MDKADETKENKKKSDNHDFQEEIINETGERFRYFSDGRVEKIED